MKKLYFLIASILLLSIFGANGQVKKDKGEFVDYKNSFWDEITNSTDFFTKKKDKKDLTFKLDFKGMDLPKSTDEFKTYWHNEPISQGNSNTCWCFCTTSFFESEIQRLFGKKIKLSEMYTVYWEYVEKARRYVREHGNSYISEGSESNALMRIYKQYGCVPEEAYTGMKPGQRFHDHRKLIAEIKTYLESVKTANAWNEDVVISTVKSILDYHLGVLPSEFVVEGKRYNPIEYFNNYVKLNMDDYVDIMSIMEQPYYQNAIYDVEDNWWKSEDYYNIPLNEYMDIIKSVVKRGFSVCIGGDVSEPGYDFRSQCAIVPTFDIPSEYIDENARQFRFSNKTSTDDHGIHLVGYTEKNGVFWFLIKDSGSGSRNGTHKGYYYYHEDYIKLKMLSIMVPRVAVEDILKLKKK